MPKRASRRRISTAIKDQRPTGREVIAFIEKFLRIPDGPDAGKPLVLSPWQQQEVCRIYDNPAGTRRAHHLHRSQERENHPLRGVSA